MKILLPLAAALVLGAAPLLARDDSFSGVTPGPGPSESAGPGLYDRIVAHYGPAGHDVDEEFRDGPCNVERKWEVNGDFEEHIKCKRPRD
jgi:hypothetical protein